MNKNMVLIADNLQITNPVISQAVGVMHPEPIQATLVKQCEAAGIEIV